MTGLGLTTGLLRYHHVFKEVAFTLFGIIGLTTIIILMVLGFFPKNPLSTILKIDYLNFRNHFLFYLSVIFTNVFLFNRAIMNADKTFNLMLKSSLGIAFFRLSVLIYFGFNKNPSVATALVLLFIIPFCFEMLFFFKKYLVFTKKSPFKLDVTFYQFLSFCFQIYIVGALFVMCDRIYLIHIKSENQSLTAILSFAFGFIGIISVFNMTFTNYFLGKINPKNINEIIEFKSRIKKYSIHFFVFTSAGIFIICFFVFQSYPKMGALIIIVLIILILKSAIVSFFGFTNVLSKTLNIQHIDLIINIIRLVLVYIIIQFSNIMGFVWTLITISMVMILGEYVLFRFVNLQISKKTV